MYLQLKLRNSGKKMEVFDPFRNKWVAATPEERVRQNFCNYLVEKLDFSPGLIANEYSVDVNGQKQRCDTAVFKNGRFVMLVEYKAQSVTITADVFRQVAAYNSIIRADYVVVTNGKQCHCCKFDFDNHTTQFLTELPKWSDL